MTSPVFSPGSPVSHLRQWSLQDAKAKFSDLVRCALASGPQLVTRGGEAAVVVVRVEEYVRMIAPRQSLVAFMSASPLAEVDLDIARSGETGRAVDL